MAHIVFYNNNQTYGKKDCPVTNHYERKIGFSYDFCNYYSTTEDGCTCTFDLQRIIFTFPDDNESCNFTTCNEQFDMTNISEEKQKLFFSCFGEFYTDLSVHEFPIPEESNPNGMQYFSSYDADVTMISEYLEIINIMLGLKKILDSITVNKKDSFESRRPDIEKIRNDILTKIRAYVKTEMEYQKKMYTNHFNKLCETLSYAFIICYIKPKFTVEQKVIPHFGKRVKAK